MGLLGLVGLVRLVGIVGIVGIMGIVGIVGIVGLVGLVGLLGLVERGECEPKPAKAWAGDVGAIVGQVLRVKAKGMQKQRK